MITPTHEERSLLHRPLRRSQRSRMVAGVCGGVAEWLRWDPTLVRVGFVALALVTSVVPMVALYALLALILPEDRAPAHDDWWEEPY